MISLRRVGVIVGHELRLQRRDPLPLMILVVFPVITIAFLTPAMKPALIAAGHPHANGAEQVVPGQTAMATFYLVSLVTFSFFAEHAWVTWDRLRASAATSFEIVLGKSLPRAIAGIAQFVVVIAAGVAVFHLRIRGNVLALAPLVLAFTLCLVLLGVAVTAVCRTAQEANSFSFLGMVLFGAIGGAFVPLSYLPRWARTIAPVTPTYWAMRGLSSVILDGRSFGDTALPAAMLAAMGVLFAIVALRRMRFDETKVGFS
jgi:ABC-2 type transport system permease protein